ncbi:HigA family addiction module antitoxin [Chishuiella sp.]|uniref:HigA family addiction module antitoxin n=1 Tax=Chishuiella sp. TaxID=1969467 RepID=UPI0028AE0DEC|nr:HigA family addiction module antitoxin [Chishuiella sp.]
MSTQQTANELIPHSATHPGVLIADELEVRDDINQKELAHLLGVKTSFLNEIIKGKRPITADTALLLEKALGIPADFWLKFQTQYDLDVARIKEKNIEKVKNIEIWNVIKTFVPIADFKKMGHLTDSIEENINKIYEIFKVNNINDFIDQFANRKFAYYRKSEKLTVNEKNLFSWSALAEYEASLMSVCEFNENNQLGLLEELKNIFYRNNNLIESIKSTLSKFGIKLIILKKFDKTPVEGYSFWSDDNPTVVLSLRYNRVDYVAFTLFHELGHIFLHLVENKEYKFLDIDDKTRTVYEDEADNFARNNLIPINLWKKFKTIKFPVQDKSILTFSNEHQIHPSIVFGRMCFENKNFKIKTSISKEIN